MLRDEYGVIGEPRSTESPFLKILLTEEVALVQTPELHMYVSIMPIPVTSEFFSGMRILGLLRSCGWQ